MAAEWRVVLDRTAVAASTAGGVARHFRIQVLDFPQSGWQLFESFASRDLAQECLDRLSRAGHAARLIPYSIYPVAA